MTLNLSHTLPDDADAALLIGRLWLPDVGPVVVAYQAGQLFDLSKLAPTVSQLCELSDPAVALRSFLPKAPRIASFSEVIANCDELSRDTSKPFLLAPCDLQAVKASGVTFVASLLERVIEEQARGDASKAQTIRAAEIFTKAPVLSAVGTGAQVGIHAKSAWNNPEPEVVLVVNSQGETVGAALGNDVNLRDFEGRSALLLGKAKDNNASCAIGPFIRLFDAGFSIDDVRSIELSLRVDGLDGFTMLGASSLKMISRDPLDLVAQAINPNHQYPDGLVLFLGTMFAPTQDRHGPGLGFTHDVGDTVSVSTPKLGALVNRVNHCDKISPWSFGITALMHNLSKRQLL